MATRPRPIIGTRGNDYLAGTSQADTIQGLSGNDTIAGSVGNDDLDGGAGIDTAAFSGTADNYSFQWLPRGVLQVTGTDGSDKLTGIERLTIGDQTYLTNGPVPHADAKTTSEDTALTFPATDLVANDTNLGQGQLAVTGVINTASTHGTVDLVNGQVVYTPAADYSGSASFQYLVANSAGVTSIGHVNVNVTATVNPLTSGVFIDRDDVPGSPDRVESLSAANSVPLLIFTEKTQSNTVIHHERQFSVEFDTNYTGLVDNATLDFTALGETAGTLGPLDVDVYVYTDTANGVVNVDDWNKGQYAGTVVIPNSDNFNSVTIDLDEAAINAALAASSDGSIGFNLRLDEAYPNPSTNTGGSSSGYLVRFYDAGVTFDYTSM